MLQSILTEVYMPIYMRRDGMVDRVPAFQPGCLGSIPGRVRDFNLYLGTGCVSFVFCPMWSLAVILTF